MVKNVFIIVFVLIINSLYSQDFDSDDWKLYVDENVITLKTTKTETLKYADLMFNVTWQDSLSYSSNIGYYSGVSQLDIYFKDDFKKTIKNIEDNIALGEIIIYIYDYNMDGLLDFAIRMDCGKVCHYNYYFFNEELSNFFYQKSWDYINLFVVNKDKKQILTEPDGTASKGSYEWYEIKGNQLNLIKVLTYGE